MVFSDLTPAVNQGAFYAGVSQGVLSDLLDERLGAYHWTADMTGPTLSFVSDADEGRRVDSPVEMLASVAPGPRSMLWGWAHPQAEGELSARLKAYGEEHSIATMTQSEVPLETEATGDALVDEIAQVGHVVGQAAVGVLGRAPYYSAPAGGGSRVLFLLTDDTLVRPRIDPTLPRHLMSAVSSGASTDHRTSFHWLAVYAGWELSWDEAWTTATVTDPVNGNTATATFTPEALLTGVELHLQS